MSNHVVLRSKRDPKPRHIHTITGLKDHDLSNIIVGLHTLIGQLEPKSHQAIQATELAHTQKGQRTVQTNTRRKRS